MNKPLEIVYDVYNSGEPDVGIDSYSDIVKVSVESGEPGSEPNEFQEYMQKCLEEWFDGARVGVGMFKAENEADDKLFDLWKKEHMDEPTD